MLQNNLLISEIKKKNLTIFTNDELSKSIKKNKK